MSVDTQYQSVPYIYKSRGAVARPILDQAPEYTYLQFLNIQEREENSVSSRYGTQIINRDAAGVGTTNYWFPASPTSISRLAFQSNAWRYVGLIDSTLWRRAGNTQGAYTQIYTGLSGQPFDSLVTNCFETSQPYLFIYDQNASIKDMGTGTPQLTGIDPPTYPVTAIPYSPLLTLIDNFASGNSYTVDGVSGWAWASITTLTASSSQIITDFPELFYSGGGGGGSSHTLPGSESVTSTQTGTGGNQQFSTAISGFPSVAIGVGQTVSVSVTVSGSTSISGFGQGGIIAQYSPDGGVSWINLFNSLFSSTVVFGPIVATASVSVSNLDLLQFRASASTGVPSSGSSASATSMISAVSATVTASSAFADVAQGMLSILNTNSTVKVPIVSIESTGEVSDYFFQALITTSAAHGLTAGFIAVYGSSNPLLDGFYQIQSVPSATEIVVNYNSAVFLSATGGFVMGGAAGGPSTCVITNEYSTPYPSQFSAWGFYQQVPSSTTSFPISCWTGTVAANSTGTIGKSVSLDLSINNQVTDDDLIVITLQVSDPANVTNIRLQFDVNGSGYTSSYYYKDIAPAYYQGNVANEVAAYQATENQILADTLGLITGAPPNSTTAQLQPGNFSTGSGSWIACFLRRGDFLPVGNAGQSGVDWTSITGWQVVVTTGTTGSSLVGINGIYLQWGYGPSSFGGVGYDYRFTYYNANTGTESTPCGEQYFDEQFGYLSTLTAPFFLRQAVRVTGYYSTDPQVTHVRVYRRGGIYADNWRQIDQIPNNNSYYQVFFYKDVIADASIAQASTLALDNDPPVTSSLVVPINTTLGAATENYYGNSIYQPAIPPPQTVTTGDTSAVFVVGQLVDVGNTNNLEQVYVITGGVGQFSAVFQLEHNAGEPVIAYSVPRAKCDLCALSNSGGVTQAWLAGDKNNPHYLYRSKPGRPENFSPADYIPVGSPDFPINAVINWRGAIIVGTTATWWIIVGGSNPYPQPTGSQHGIVAKHGWIEVEGAIWYQSQDGFREFTGADGIDKYGMIEWVFRDQPLSLIPLADLAQLSQTILCYYQGEVYCSYVSQNDGQRYRLIYNRLYDRWRYDDVPATAMFWEKDTNTFLVGKEVTFGNFAVVEDQVYTVDYDDGGWVGSEIEQIPIEIVIQTPYKDLGKPHYPKQWNMLETDVNTNGMILNTTLLFDDGDSISNIVLPTQNTGTTRKKIQFVITGDAGADPDAGDGQQAYRMSILHSMAVVKAPILYQEDVYAAVLADLNNSFDTYWIKFNTDHSKLIKEGYFDYTSTVSINVNLFADGSVTPYYSFVLPAQPNRDVVRVRFGNVNNGTTAFTCRTWRMIMLSGDFSVAFQLWRAPQISVKGIQENHSYEVKELTGTV